MSVPVWLNALGRIANAIMDAINVKRKKASPADIISGDGRVLKSDLKFSDISKKDDGNRTE